MAILVETFALFTLHKVDVAEVQLSHSISLLEKGCRKAIFNLEADEDAKMLQQQANMSALRIQDLQVKLTLGKEQQLGTRFLQSHEERPQSWGERYILHLNLNRYNQTQYIGKSSAGFKRTIHFHIFVSLPSNRYIGKSHPR